MVYDEIIRIAKDQKARQTIDRMRMERIKELKDDLNRRITEIHNRINCVYSGEEDHLIENVLHGKRTLTEIQVSETKRIQKGKQILNSKL